MKKFENQLDEVLESVKQLLLAKNKAYGSSFSDQIGIFSKLDPIEAINIRIDDKLKRIRNQDTDEDAEIDLIGYLVLKKILVNMNEKN